MSFLRPEALAGLRRYREILAGVGLGALGLWWLLGPGRFLTLPGLALLGLGAALIWIGVARARFRAPGDGPGAVTVTEGQIAYFGPETGGAVALSEIAALILDRPPSGARWRLEQPGQPPLHIPVSAAGAEALFDAFASLPGLNTNLLLAALQVESPGETILWQRDPRPRRHLPLH